VDKREKNGKDVFGHEEGTGKQIGVRAKTTGEAPSTRTQGGLRVAPSLP